MATQGLDAASPWGMTVFFAKSKRRDASGKA